MLLFFLSWLFKLPGPWNWNQEESLPCSISSSEQLYANEDPIYKVTLDPPPSSGLDRMVYWGPGYCRTRVAVGDVVYVRLKRNIHFHRKAKVMEVPAVVIR